MMLRILVVDDSALYRKTISDILNADPAIEVVGTAHNGRMALEKIPRLSPDVITLDMEMPEMDGLATLKILRRDFNNVKTVVFSAHTERGAELTIEALNLGAVDFVTKPGRNQKMDASLEQMKQELLPKILAFAQRNRTRSSLARDNKQQQKTGIVAVPVRSFPRPVVKKRQVIAIGVSTGGPKSLEVFFHSLPASLNPAILIVQHMPPIFTRKLAEQLGRDGKIPVCEAQDGEVIKSGHAYIAPGGQHMTVRNGGAEIIVSLNADPPENFCRPSVDVLFRSVAEAYGQRAIGVIMTGMGDDGCAGSRVMKETGIPIIAQDEETSVVWGMPGAVVKNGLADRISPLKKIYATICDYSL